MKKSAWEFLHRLLETPGPVGDEAAVQAVFEEHVSAHADEVVHLAHGSVAAIRNPGGAPRLIVTGHADEIGLTVHHIDDKGFVYVRPLGGVDVLTLPGSVLEIHAAAGTVPAVVGRKPVHLQDGDERTRVGKISQIYLDIGARTKAEARRLVRPGDPITFRRGVTRLGRDLVSSKSLDNRSGLFCAAETLVRIGRAAPRACVIALSTVGEEIGGDGALTAAFDLRPDVAVAIDVTFTSDQPDLSPQDTAEVNLGSGPVIGRGPRVNPTVVALLEKAGKKTRIPVQYEVLPGRTGTDGDPIYRSRSGVPIGTLSIPCRYMHTPAEVVSLQDLDRTAAMLVAFALDLGPKTTLRPFERQIRAARR